MRQFALTVHKQVTSSKTKGNVILELMKALIDGAAETLQELEEMTVDGVGAGPSVAKNMRYPESLKVGVAALVDLMLE